MSTTFDHGGVVFECDNCHESLETGCTDFSEAVNFMKGVEWLTIKFAGEWKNFCSVECRSEFWKARREKVSIV